MLWRNEPHYPVFEWAVAKCTELGGQKLKMTGRFIDKCITDVQYIEWWDHNRNQLPPQYIEDCQWYLSSVAEHDAVDILAWWHAHGFPTTKSDWQRVPSTAIGMDACRVILWLRNHPELLFSESDKEYALFVDECKTKLHCSKPCALDTVATIVGDPDPPLHDPKRMFVRLTVLLWWCHRHCVTVAALLPLDPSFLDELINMRHMVMVEWWVQVHEAASHRIVISTADKFDKHCRWTIDTHVWLYDVTVTRGIPQHACIPRTTEDRGLGFNYVLPHVHARDLAGACKTLT
ncbi:hypothetical protein BC828DRAFT_399473 [Blastocladiella britannica]|nr:hypothetical protein BC828DRAFT_399473 [Blastocladiella britannica]